MKQTPAPEFMPGHDDDDTYDADAAIAALEAHHQTYRRKTRHEENTMSTDALAKFRKDHSDWKPFIKYDVTIRVVDLVGGIPKGDKPIDGWLAARNKNKTKEERDAMADATKEELGDLVAEAAEKSSTGFKSDTDGLYIECRQLKAMLKESANIIRTIAPGKVKGKLVTGVTALKSKVADQVFVLGDKIHFGRDKPDAIEERPIHVQTPQGKRDALKRVEIVYDVELKFTVALRRGSEVTESTLIAILDYAQQLGLGADRSQGRGRFELVSVTRME